MKAFRILSHVGTLALLTWDTATALVVERAPQPLITPAPELPAQLEKRDGLTWAYVDGDSASPLTCPPDFTTSNTIGFAGYQACCNAVSCLNDWQTCLPYGVTLCTLKLPCSDLFTSFLTCGQAQPGCITYKSITGPNDPEGVLSFGCGPTNTVLLALGSPTAANGAVVTTAVSTAFAAGAAASTLYSTAGVTYDSLGLGGETVISDSSVIGTTSSALASTAPTNSAPSVSPSTFSTSSSLSSPSPTSSSSLSIGSSPSATAIASGSASSDSNSSSSSSGKLDTGTIVGIVAGVVSLIAIFVTVWLKWPKTITRFLTCGICTTIDDDAPQIGRHHGLPLRYIPRRYDAPPPDYQYQHPMHYS